MTRGEQRPSVLLSREENEMVFSMIGPKCQSLATAVVQLFTTEGPAHSEWKKRDTGVLCLIKDNGKRSYFFRIYCLYRKTMVWEHEIYLQIEYKSPRPFLHTFEAEEYMTAFNFANEDEAMLLRTILIEKIEIRKSKREDKRKRALLLAQQTAANASGAGAGTIRQNGAPPPVPAPAPALPPKAAPMTAGSAYTLKGSKKPKARKLTKADIGMPQDFKHISHVGWDQHKGFDVEKLPNDELRSFFSKAGVSETQLEDEETRDFIYGFIETHGGLDAVKEDLYKPSKGVSRPPPLPTSAAPPVPARSPAPAHPPAPPSRAPPPPPARAVPPPPAPPSQRAPPPPRPAQPSFALPSSGPPPVTPPPPPGAAPPPPAPPPPPPMPADAAVEPDARAALMESIRSGNKTLKRVEPNQTPRPQIDDSRSNLLSEIRQGTKLKAVSRSTSSGSSGREAPPALEHGLAGLLKRALDERNRAIHSDSDSDSDQSGDESNDDDWD